MFPQTQIIGSSAILVSRWLQKTAIRRCVGALLLLLALTHPAAATTLEGKPTYSDGDTVEIQGQKIRLLGIDTPEFSQTCRDSVGKSYQCGVSALNHLKRLVGGRPVRCEGDELDQYGRLLAICYAGGVDMNRQLVLDGWAVAFVKYDRRYLPEENAAKASGRGMWEGEFSRPADYRAERWADAAQGTNHSGPPSDECVIKGNINRKGNKIYHTPWGSRDYDRTRIDTSKGERWFCSESEATAAGWRAPMR